jgi:hypothetical protein
VTGPSGHAVQFDGIARRDFGHAKFNVEGKLFSVESKLAPGALIVPAVQPRSSFSLYKFRASSGTMAAHFFHWRKIQASRISRTHHLQQQENKN